MSFELAAHLTPENNAEILLKEKSKSKAVLCIIVSAIGIFAGVMLMHAGEPGYGLVTIIFSSVFVLFFIIVLISDAGRLELNKDGFTSFTLFGNIKTHWTEVEKFGTASIKQYGFITVQKIVCYNFSDQKGKSGIVVKGWSGFDSRLPDNYGIPADELTNLMNAWLNYYRPKSS